MQSQLAALTIALAVSACAQPTLMGNLNRDCNGRVAMTPYRPNHMIINGFGAQTVGMVTAYDPFSTRFNLRASDCSRVGPTQPPSPRSYDLDKVGGASEPGAMTLVSDAWKPCPRSRV